MSQQIGPTLCLSQPVSSINDVQSTAHQYKRFVSLVRFDWLCHDPENLPPAVLDNQITLLLRKKKQTNLCLSPVYTFA